MDRLVPVSESDSDLLVVYSVDREEETCEAVVEAFQAANIDVFEKPTTIDDWLDADVFNDLTWPSDSPLLLRTQIWEHPVVITGEEVRIYGPSADL